MTFDTEAIHRYTTGVLVSRAAYDLTEAALATEDPSICKVSECDELREDRCVYCVCHVREYSPAKWWKLGLAYWSERLS